MTITERSYKIFCQSGKDYFDSLNFIQQVFLSLILEKLSVSKNRYNNVVEIEKQELFDGLAAEDKFKILQDIYKIVETSNFFLARDLENKTGEGFMVIENILGTKEEINFKVVLFKETFKFLKKMSKDKDLNIFLTSIKK